MKYFKIISLFIVTFFLSACSDEDNQLSTDSKDTAIYLRTISNNSTLFTPSSFSTSKIDLNLEIGGNSAEQNLSVLNVYLTYNDSENVYVGAEKLIASYGLGDFVKDDTSGLLRKNFVYTTQQIFTALGMNDLVYDDSDKIVIRFEAVAKNGKKFTNTNLGQELTTGYYKSPFIYNFTVLCPYNSNLYNGDYEVVADTWKDYFVGDIVPVVSGPNTNQFKILSTNNPYLVNTSSYILVTITNTTSGAVTISSNEAFDYGASSGIYTVSGSGTVDLCNGNINLTGIMFGGSAYNFQLKKK